MLGKIAGGVVGAVIGLGLGDGLVALTLAIAGVLLGHLVVDRDADRRRSTPNAVGPRAASSRERELARVLAPIFIEVARVDGEVRPGEIRETKALFEDELRFGPEGLEALRLELKAAIARPVAALEPLVRGARGALEPPLRLTLMHALYAQALSDGPLTRAERDALKTVTQALNLSDEQLQAITTRHLGEGEAHYRALGLDGSASDDELKAAWRRLALEHHPDRFVGKPAGEQAAARARFEATQAAWEAVKALRGL